MNLGKSDINGFKICHEAEFDINDESCLNDFPFDPILPLESSDNLVSAFANRNYMGAYVNLLRAEEKSFVFNGKLKGQNAIDKFNQEIKDKIHKYKTDRFYINTFCPSIGWYLTKVYVGSKIETVTVSLNPLVTKVKLELIEVNGILINK